MENSIKTEAVVKNIEQKPIFFEPQAENTKTTSTTSKPEHTKRTGPTAIENGIIKRKQRLFKNLTLVQKPQKEKFTLYLKKRFLNVFCERGCTPELIDTCISTYNVDENEVKGKCILSKCFNIYNRKLIAFQSILVQLQKKPNNIFIRNAIL